MLTIDLSNLDRQKQLFLLNLDLDIGQNILFY
jgi:hypothetical protein